MSAAATDNSIAVRRLQDTVATLAAQLKETHARLNKAIDDIIALQSQQRVDRYDIQFSERRVDEICRERIPDLDDRMDAVERRVRTSEEAGAGW